MRVRSQSLKYRDELGISGEAHGNERVRFGSLDAVRHRSGEDGRTVLSLRGATVDIGQATHPKLGECLGEHESIQASLPIGALMGEWARTNASSHLESEPLLATRDRVPHENALNPSDQS